MYKWKDIGIYFNYADASQSTVPLYTNLSDDPGIQLYSDKTKSKPRSDLIRDSKIYLHGSSSSTAYPFFEFTDVNDMPLVIKFKMRLTFKSNHISQLGDLDYFFITDDTDTTKGAIGIKYLNAEYRILKPFFIDDTNTIRYQLTEGIKDRQWFNVEFLYFKDKLYFKLNDRIINSVDWSSDIEKGFRLKLKGDYFYFDYSDIVISKIEYMLRDVPFEVFITQSDVDNGSITLTADHTILE